MKTLVIYDSAYGNTAKVATAIAEAMRPYGEVKKVLAEHFSEDEATDVNVIFIGSPTQGGRPTEPIQEVVRELDARQLNNVHIAPFDTRLAINAHGRALKMLMSVIGFAAPKIARVNYKRSMPAL